MLKAHQLIFARIKTVVLMLRMFKNTPINIYQNKDNNFNVTYV